MTYENKKKAGIVALVGRSNVGKSTLLNTILKQKVAITSPKPQTTRFPIQAVFEDERGQIIFVDTPGVYEKSSDTHTKSSVSIIQEMIQQKPDIVVYIIDHTRARDHEENLILGQVRKMDVPKILVVNKTDLHKPDYAAEYAFYEDEFPEIIKLSALTHKNVNLLINKIFLMLPNRQTLVDTSQLVQPALNMDSKLFISEIIREKVFLFMQEEVPYSVNTRVDVISERNDRILYIKGIITTTKAQYKKMLIGANGKMIKKIGMAVRKELEQASGKQVYIDLSVEVASY